VHNTALTLNSSENLSPYLPDTHHRSDDAFCRGGGTELTFISYDKLAICSNMLLSRTDYYIWITPTQLSHDSLLTLTFNQLSTSLTCPVRKSLQVIFLNFKNLTQITHIKELLVYFLHNIIIWMNIQCCKRLHLEFHLSSCALQESKFAASD